MRKAQLDQQKLASPQKDQELAKIRNVLPAFYAQHGPELVHAFITLVTEYVPLRNSLIPVIVQAQAMMEQAAQQAAAHQAQQQQHQDEKGEPGDQGDDGLDNYDSDGAAPEQGKPETD
jgi:hypothetical protein